MSKKGLFLKFLFLHLILLMAPAYPGYVNCFLVSAQAGERNVSIDLSTAIARVAKENIPAVVHVDVIQRQKVIGPFFPNFFDLPFRPHNFRNELSALGTGMFMDTQGHILTNNHVAGGATTLEVLLANGRRYPAKLVGADPKTDLAVMRIFAKGPVPHVNFGDSDQVQVGDWVVAIGHPRGLVQTVTKGIISAKHRRGIMDPNGYQDFLQTDAAINPGNSGGPLLNLSGEVIGVNTAIISHSGGFEGMGFAIPSNMATHVARQLLDHGRVARGWVGARIEALAPDLAESIGLARATGALVVQVAKGSPADKAGIKRGDVVVRYRGKDVSDSSTLQNEVAASPIGEEVDITVFRNGRTQTLKVRPASLQAMIRGKNFSIEGRLGVDVRPVKPEEVQRYGLNPRRGLVITSVFPDSPLATSGFEVNDVVLEVNGLQIRGVEDLVALIRSLRPDQRIVVLGLDHRSGRAGFVQIVVP